MIKQVSFLAALLFSSMANAGFYSGSGLLAESGGYVKNKSGEATVAEALNGGMLWDTSPAYSIPILCRAIAISVRLPG
ncbi:Uncharacterised protein [Serratia marcescens]|nr:Uncharacterised protein [Serratia marcescens]